MDQVKEVDQVKMEKEVEVEVSADEDVGVDEVEMEMEMEGLVVEDEDLNNAGSDEFHEEVKKFLVEVQRWKQGNEGKKGELDSYTIGIPLLVGKSHPYFYVIADSAIVSDPNFKGTYRVSFRDASPNENQTPKVKDAQHVQFHLSDVKIQDGIALIYVPRGKIPIQAVEISDRPVCDNQTVYLFSYEPIPREGKKGRLTPGNVTFAGLEFLRHDCDTLVADDSSRGDQGSPLFSTRGQLVGIIDAEDTRLAMNGEGIRKRLNAMFNRNDECMDAILQHVRTIGDEKSRC